jgi:acetolactate synthase I/II/III large subunit
MVCDAGLAVQALDWCCRQKLVAGDRRARDRAERHGEHHRRLRQTWAAEARQAAGRTPIATAHLAAAMWEAIGATDWVLTANTVRDWARRLWDFDQPHRHPGQSLGTATQIGISLGVALAHRGGW